MASLPNVADISISGHTYPTPAVRAFVARICSSLFLLALGLAVLGGQLNNIPFIPRQVVRVVSERRGTIVGVGFALNMVASVISQTGAFEVYVDDTLVYSKLQTGEVPTAVNVARLVLQHTAG